MREWLSLLLSWNVGVDLEGVFQLSLFLLLLAEIHQVIFQS